MTFEKQRFISCCFSVLVTMGMRGITTITPKLTGGKFHPSLKETSETLKIFDLSFPWPPKTNNRYNSLLLSAAALSNQDMNESWLKNTSAFTKIRWDHNFCLLTFDNDYQGPARIISFSFTVLWEKFGRFDKNFYSEVT